ncbi:hypothetical protein EVAR_92507_1 [Eumeta japonica]|uniref:Uncharacterized protein n=1 Tax=Eumeta variegata TaxID=151549 RepID=A0A4C1T982_EUMVA|nr:hypothetical protein EVAR_92507_1 [Eumeta japonica]
MLFEVSKILIGSYGIENCNTLEWPRTGGVWESRDESAETVASRVAASGRNFGVGVALRARRVATDTLTMSARDITLR